MYRQLFVALFFLNYFIHLYLCRKFDTKAQKIKTVLFYSFLACILIRYFSQDLDVNSILFLLIGWTIVLIDEEHHRIPNFLTGYFSIAICVIAIVENQILGSIAGGAEFLLFFCVLAIASKLKIGIGDVKLAGVIGLINGLVTLQELMIFVLLSAILGLCSLLTGPTGIHLKARIPFSAPMIAASNLIWPIWPIWPMLHMKG
jgi:leader peptidase (prepilin peptidase)/N-methyltransferase